MNINGSTDKHSAQLPRLAGEARKFVSQQLKETGTSS